MAPSPIFVQMPFSMFKKLRLLLYPLIFALTHSLISYGQQYKTLDNGQRLFESKQLDAAEILHEIKKLNTVGSVLYIAAHPDDENTRLLSYLANERGVRTAYLALTRGDGGQNLLGKEQGDLLGLIRTQELLAARRTDGAEQYFTRAVDFGFSKNPEETFKIWNHDSILADVVWVIRKFQPDVIITRFNSDGSGGHGHHTASSILAQEAFDAAADRSKFPEQLKYVSIWRAKRILWNNPGRNWNPKADLTGLIPVEVGQYNALLGESYGEMAARSRSMHKSQGFGSAERRGSALEYFKLFKGDSFKTDIFDGIDLTWNRVGNKKVSDLVDQVIKEYDPLQPDKSVPVLVKIYQALKNGDDRFAKLKADQVKALILQAAGVFIEFNASDYSVVPGALITVNTSILNRSNIPIHWSEESFEASILTDSAAIDSTVSRRTIGKMLSSNQQYSDTALLRISGAYPYTMEYWLRQKHTQGLFSVHDYDYLGLAEQFGWVYGSVKLQIEGEEFEIFRRINYKWVDPVTGEQSRNLEVAPPVTVDIDEKVYMLPGNTPKEVKMVVKSGMDKMNGTLRFDLPPGWTVAPAKVPFSLAKKGDEQSVTVTVTPPKDAVNAVTFKAIADVNGRSFSYSVARISYPHIPEEVVFSAAEVKLVPLDVKIAGKRIGYIPGAGDAIPASLRNIGYTVEELTDEQIDNSDLSKYDAIVVGVRAYNTNDRMSFHYTKLMKYVENGGNLIVQYNTANNISSISSDIGPYPFALSRDRVTVEESPVTFLDPSHAALTTPNKITQKDFEGWIQERGLYFAKDWDSKYVAPLEMNEPNEKPNKGSLIIVPYGKGNFVYTGISFFRELPAGVPGAYRLFVNLLSL
jgi:LmbE family N-acetylglucosaminyl deacetylase